MLCYLFALVFLLSNKIPKVFNTLKFEMLLKQMMKLLNGLKKTIYIEKYVDILEMAILFIQLFYFFLR